MDYRPLGRTGIKVSPGVTPVELAVAFVLTHPAVSSAIIGPRTMEQLELVPPGTDVVPWEFPYAPPALTDAGLRRR